VVGVPGSVDRADRATPLAIEDGVRRGGHDHDRFHRQRGRATAFGAAAAGMRAQRTGEREGDVGGPGRGC
jgi:hypothetical protein